MVKILSNKYGVIQIEDECIKKDIVQSLELVINKSDLIKIELFTKKANLSKIEVYFKKNSKISQIEQKNLYDNILFLLSSNYGINNSLIVFNYEN